MDPLRAIRGGQAARDLVHRRVENFRGFYHPPFSRFEIILQYASDARIDITDGLLLKNMWIGEMKRPVRGLAHLPMIPVSMSPARQFDQRGAVIQNRLGLTRTAHVDIVPLAALLHVIGSCEKVSTWVCPAH